WTAERLFDGWTYAPGEKDVEHMTSPSLVSWDELSEDVRELDRDAVRGLPAFLAAAGLRVVEAAGD
ncbi:MAG: RyR domain-containing protein, partial [Gaiellaceae bacterium]